MFKFSGGDFFTYRGDNINTPPLGVTPTENIWRNLENNLTPKKEFAREAHEKILGFFRAVLQGKIVQNGVTVENITTPSQPEPNIFENLENNVTPREKIWDFIVKGGY